MKMNSNLFTISRKFYFSILFAIFCMFLLTSCSQDDPADAPVEKKRQNLHL